MSGPTLYPELEQGSDEWLQARCGLLTASVIGSLITQSTPDPTYFACTECAAAEGDPCVSLARTSKPTPIKTVHSKRSAAAVESGETVLTIAKTDAARGIINSLAAERITGHVEPMFITSDMQRGIEEEPLARQAYCEHTGREVTELGFMVREEEGFRVGYSPDGMVAKGGLIEIKSRRNKRHVEIVTNGDTPNENMAQIQTGLWVSGEPWCDYIDYSAGMALVIYRVEPDPKWFAAIEATAQHFEQAVTDVVDRYVKATDGLPIMERLDLELVI